MSRVFVLTWVAYASYYLTRKNFSVSKSAIEDAFGLDPRALGLIDTGYLAAYAVGQFAMGLLGDRIGSRRLVGVGMIVSAALTATAGASGTVIAIALCLGANGFAQASGWPGTVKALTPWVDPARRGRVMGMWSTCYQVGGLVAGAVASYLVKHAGWRAAFVIPALWVAVIGGLILVALPEARPAAGAERAAARRRLLASPSVWALGLAYFCLKLIRYSLLFWLPYYLERSLGYARGIAGYQSLSFEIGGIAGAIAIGAVSDRWFGGRRGLAGLGGCLGLAAALALYVLVSRVGAFANFAAMALVGFLLFGPDALVSAASAQDLGGREASATAAGWINGLGSIGAVLQGVLTAEVSARFGWDALFYVFVALALLAALAMVPRVLAERAAMPQKRPRAQSG
ncbi:MAG: MFS transporter [Myxococcota bacterium]